jgi:hypothetical protein
MRTIVELFLKHWHFTRGGQSVCPAIRWLAFLLLILMLPAGIKSYGQEPARQPSTLKNFLLHTKNATVVGKEVGVFTGIGKDKATFTAIVAWDPHQPAVKVKGIEVHLQEGGREWAVYLDDDKEDATHCNLVEFQEDLIRLARLKQKLTERCTAGYEASCNQPGLTAPGCASTSVTNRSEPTQDGYYPRDSVMGAGFCGSGRAVLINCAIPRAGDPGIAVMLPGADLNDVVKAIAGGKAFLDAN